MGGVLLKGGCVLSLDRRVGNLREADVLIEDGKVAEVGPGLRSRDAEPVDASDTIVMPGFVDSHRHAWRTLLKNAAGSTSDAASAVAAYGPRHEPDDVYAATLIGLLSAVESGITTVVDVADIQVDERYTEATLQAHADAGLRTVFVHARPAWAQEAGDAHAAVRRLVSDRAELADPRTTIAFGSADPATSGLDRTASDWAFARELGLRIHAHAGVGSTERGVVAALAAHGALGDDVTLAHGTHLDDDDLDAIASHGAALALTPASEMARGIGTPPMQRLVDRGIRPGLGVDDELLMPGELFAQMRSAQSLQHAAAFDLKLAGKAGIPDLLSTRDTIRYATVDGARAAGLGEVTGTLAPGMQADILVLRTDRPNIFPINDPIGAVVWGMDASNVDWVFVGGQPLLRHGVLEADVGRVRDLAIAARQRISPTDRLLETTEGGTR